MNAVDFRHRVRELIQSTVERLGYDLVAVEWVKESNRQILRVSIDRPTGISADDCALVSEHVSPLLEEGDVVPGRYHLEVSSPGIERPVQRRRDFERFSGFRAKLRLVEGHPRRRYTGTLAGLDGDEVLIDVDGTRHHVFLDTIDRAHLVLDLDEYKRLAEVHHDDQ